MKKILPNVNSSVTQCRCKLVETPEKVEMSEAAYEMLSRNRSRNIEAKYLLSNLREYCLPYSPIVEGIDEVLNVLRGKPIPKEKEEMKTSNLLKNIPTEEIAVAYTHSFRVGDRVAIEAEKYAKLVDDSNTLNRLLQSDTSTKLQAYRNNVISKGVLKFGHTLQTFTAVEEMGELIQALSKNLRGQGDRNNTLEEIVDVAICLETLRLIYGIDRLQFEKVMFDKLNKFEKILNADK